MPIIVIPITPVGPLIEVAVGLSMPHQGVLQNIGQPLPSMVISRMLIDTGASHCAVDKSVIQQLNLTPTGKVTIMTPSTDGVPKECDQYDVSVHILHEKLNFRFNSMPVIAGDFKSQGHLGLLGRDILKDCSLVYHGTANIFSLAF